MGLTAFKNTFLRIRTSCEIIVRKHAFTDYPQRGFSVRELVHLVRKGSGRFEDNKSAQAIKDSYLFFPKDEQGKECKLVVLVEIMEIDDEHSMEEKKAIIVCSAYRSIDHEV